MTTAEILARVNAALSLCDSGASPSMALCALRDDLEAQIRLESAASRGALNATRTIKAMLDSLKKNDARKALHYAWIDGEGRQCACDGYRAYRLREHLPLEPRPEDAGEAIDLDRIMPDVSTGRYAAVPLPSMAELRAFIAVERAKHTFKRGKRAPDIYYDLGDGAPLVNAQYLLDMLAVFPDAAEIFYSYAADGRYAPLVIRSERGDGILLPVRDAEKDLRLGERMIAARDRVKDYPLPEDTDRKSFALNALRGSNDKALSPDDFAACLDLVASVA